MPDDGCSEKKKQRGPVVVVSHGLYWCIGWLFTLGYVHLPFWKGVLALLIWPYYLGAKLG